MENENKDKNVILTDEQLKEVAGGGTPDSGFVSNPCAFRKSPIVCKQHQGCMWTGSKCTVKPNS